jgi:mono/diheme cytochrome c family protein
MRLVKALLVLVLLAILALGAFAYLGWYEIGADVPHSQPVVEFLDVFRDRAVAVRARGIEVPKLGTPEQLSEGAEHYAEMCAGCHLAPGIKDSEIRMGLYPQPPRLDQPDLPTPAEQFWIIKHGLKFSAMPAWGKSHDDAKIWALVAFVQKLPGMSPEQYSSMTGSSEGEHHHHHDEPAEKSDSADHAEHADHDKQPEQSSEPEKDHQH